MLCSIRTMQLNDLDAILTIQASVYPPDILEDRAFFENRLALSPETCWVAEINQQLVGYLVAYPWSLESPPELNVLITQIPKTANSLFLHDCAVLHQTQGQGVGKRLHQVAIQYAQAYRLKSTSLVSLKQANRYWMQHGYQSIDSTPRLQQKLLKYGDGACHMFYSLG